jgi:hypothetical protein
MGSSLASRSLRGESGVGIYAPPLGHPLGRTFDSYQPSFSSINDSEIIQPGPAFFCKMDLLVPWKISGFDWNPSFADRWVKSGCHRFSDWNHHIAFSPFLGIAPKSFEERVSTWSIAQLFSL